MSTPKDQISPDGVPSDGVGHDFATVDQLARFQEASDALSRFRTPVLVHADNPHERLFVASFDGTGNNKIKDPLHATNVARIHDQIAGRIGENQIHSEYHIGPGTQDNELVAKADLARGFTYEKNLNDMYSDLVKRSNEWKAADPDAVIRVQSIGFSRGASQAAGFTRLVHEQGIPNTESFSGFDVNGRATYAQYHVAPGQVTQTVGLLDPVATGVPMNFDRRLPSSVVSGFQITSADEQRATFPSDRIIPPGLSEDGRFLNVTVPGAHSDVGGGYQRNGLSVRSGNLMTDYLNSASDTPYLQKRFEPDDARYNVIHRSTEGMSIYRMDPRESVRDAPSGTNVQLAPKHVTEAGPLPHTAEAANAEMVRSLDYRPVAIGPKATTPEFMPPAMADEKAMAEAARSVPFAPKVVAGASVIAVGADIIRTGLHTADLANQHNITGAGSAVMHLGGRTIGMVAGAEIVGGALAVGGAETGPGAFILGAGGAALGAMGGSKAADLIDNYRINHQTDPEGRPWHLDPSHPEQGWQSSLPPLPGVQRPTADAALNNQLDYQASSRAAELRMGNPGELPDPYTQPSGPHDAPHPEVSDWSRDPQSHAWTRSVVTGVVDRVVLRETETANPARAAELNHAAEQTVVQNRANSPQGVAETYQQFYQQRGWDKLGPMPETVTSTLHDAGTKAMASDGHTYTRGQDGQWATPGRIWGEKSAQGNVRDELDTTYQHERPINAAPTAASPVAQAPHFDDPEHPGHTMYKQIHDQVCKIDSDLGRKPDQHSANLAGALTVAAKEAGLTRADNVTPNADGSRFIVTQTIIPRTVYEHAQVETQQAIKTPLEQSSAQHLQAQVHTQALAQGQVQRQEQAQTQAQNPNQTQAQQAPQLQITPSSR